MLVNFNKVDYKVEVDTKQPPSAFKRKIEELTGVPLERQKILGLKGGPLKDEANWASLGLKEVCSPLFLLLPFFD